jgi:hypothetical protein
LNGPVQPFEGLAREISAVHPRTLWASVRREGDWSSFDYYYQLGFATRQFVADTAGAQIKDLKTLIAHLSSHPDYVDARDFLRQIADYADAAVEQLTRQVQVSGQTLYRTPLHGAVAYWDSSEKVYGTGNPFRLIVAENTRQLSRTEALAELHLRLEEEINRGWRELVEGLAKILESPTAPPDSAAA